MTTTIYKRLFEVRIFHDYFLSEADGTPFSAMNASAQNAFLRDALLHQRYDIQRFLHIEPSAEMKTMLQNYRMRIMPTPLGFFLGLEVRQSENGATLYEPFISLAGRGRSMTFLLKPGNELFYNYTNVSLQDVFPSRWYFTNKYVEGEKAPNGKVLSSIIPAKDTNAAYDMGTLVRDGEQVQEAYPALDGAPAFLDVKGAGFVVNRDRFLLPRRFNYDLGRSIIEEVTFRLLQGGNEVKTIRKAAGTKARFVSLNFEIQDDEAKTPLPEGNYTLQVSTAGTDRQVALRDSLYDKSAFGAIEIFPFAGNPAFDLLDDQGKLWARIDAQGNKQPHPVFELRFAGRKAFWRYRSKEAIAQSTIDKYGEFLQPVGDPVSMLVSKIPRAFSQNLSYFSEALIPPQPSAYALKREAGRYYADIQLSPVLQFNQD